MYAAQEIPQIDTEIAQKGHFRMETKLKGANYMHNKNELCQKIKSLYPDIGECGIDVIVDYDVAKKAWIVDLKKGNQELKTHLEPEDADVCMAGKQCIGLGIQIAQLRSNIGGT